VDPKLMHKFDPNVNYNAACGEEAMGGAMTDGTTIIACKYNGGILLAADGRSSNVSEYLKFLHLIIILTLLEHVCWKLMFR
jgi:20S proteasome alpha/beta subunit